MIESSEIKAPLDEQFLAYIPATVALAHWGEPQAVLDLGALYAAKDARLPAKALKHAGRLLGKRSERVDRGPVPYQSEELVDRVIQALGHRVAQVRRQAIELATYHPDARYFAPLAPHLNDRSRELRGLAGEAMRQSYCGRESSLEAVYPWLEYLRPPQGDSEDAERRSEDYEVRIRAVHALCFEHGSKIAQEKLLNVFDRPELGVKRELTGAFRYCPDLPGLQAEMLARFRGSDEKAGLSALFVLGIFRDPALRQLFRDALFDFTPKHALAGLMGLYPLLDKDDFPILQTCRDHWRPPGI